MLYTLPDAQASRRTYICLRSYVDGAFVAPRASAGNALSGLKLSPVIPPFPQPSPLASIPLQMAMRLPATGHRNRADAKPRTA